MFGFEAVFDSCASLKTTVLRSNREKCGRNVFGLPTMANGQQRPLVPRGWEPETAQECEERKAKAPPGPNRIAKSPRGSTGPKICRGLLEIPEEFLERKIKGIGEPLKKVWPLPCNRCRRLKLECKQRFNAIKNKHVCLICH